jgi:hypothetical protein
MQQINLHQPVVRRKQGTLSAQTACAALLTIVLALAGIWAFAWWQLHGMGREVDLARAQQQAQRAQQAAQTAQLDALSQEELDLLTAKLSAAIEVKSRAMTLIQSESSVRAGFAERLAALATRHVDGIWLDQLTLGASRDAMSLSGSALTPDLVPRYLQSLAGDPALRGGEIDNFVIDRLPASRQGGASQLHFHAATRALPVPVAAPSES